MNLFTKCVGTLTLGLFLTPLSAFAGDSTGTIKYIAVRGDGLHWLEVNTTHDRRPACAVNQYWIIQNENSSAGKDQYTTLLAAYMANRTVTIVGTNTCSRWGDGEDISYVQLQ